MSELKYVWGILKQNPEDKDMIRAFERVATPEAVKKLLMENEQLQAKLNKRQTSIDVRVQDLFDLAEKTKEIGMRSNRDNFRFDLATPVSNTTNQLDYNFAIVKVRKDYNFGWLARFELMEKGDE